MGVDDREYVPGPEVGEFGQNIMVRNPMYGMDAMEQANYTLALNELKSAQEAALQTGTEINTTTNLMNHLATLGDPNFTTAVLEEIRGVIDDAPGMVTKGLTDANVLHALGELSKKQAPDGTYPYRDMFAIVQGMGTEDLLSTGTTDETTQAIEDAAAAAAAAASTTAPTGPSTGAGDSQGATPAGMETPNITARGRSQGTHHVGPGDSAVDPTAAAYSDINGTVFSQGNLDKIEAEMPQGGPDAPWLNPAYEPGVIGYIDWAARAGYVFDRVWDGNTFVLVTGEAHERP
jgi:hypothetical protein